MLIMCAALTWRYTDGVGVVAELQGGEAGGKFVKGVTGGLIIVK
jgi:hypothetical protein